MFEPFSELRPTVVAEPRMRDKTVYIQVYA